VAVLTITAFALEHSLPPGLSWLCACGLTKTQGSRPAVGWPLGVVEFTNSGLVETVPVAATNQQAVFKATQRFKATSGFIETVFCLA